MAPDPAPSLGEIVAALGGELIGDAAARVTALGTLDDATGETLAFLANPAYVRQLATSTAGAVIVGPANREAALARGNTIVAADPYLYYARLTRWWAARTARPVPAGIHSTAVVHASARVEGGSSVGAHAVIEAEAVIGSGAIVGANAYIGAGCRIGAATRLAPNVSVMSGTLMGVRCIVHAGAVIGADGFGFAPTPAGWEKIEQLGNVVIGDDVEIGANTCIDRGALGDTVIGDGVKIDNLVQIAHNVRIGAHTAIAGNVGIAGSATIGERCMLGGGAGVIGHVSIAADTIITAATQVTRSITVPGTYSGMFPFDDNESWEKNAATLRNLHRLRERVRALEKKTS